MPCTKEKKILLWLIDSYKNMPYLWQRDHEDYMNKSMREEGFKALLEIYKNFDENANVKILKKKIENMRTSYSKELKKVHTNLMATQLMCMFSLGPLEMGRISNFNGNVTEDGISLDGVLASKHAGEVYIPTLWYFDAISFVNNDMECSHTVVCDPLEKTNSSLDDETESLANSDNSRRKRKIFFSTTEKKQYIQNQEHIVLPLENNMAKNNVEFEIYGRSIGFQMKDLSKRQLMISQKIISDVLYYAKLNQLSESSCVYLGPSEESTSNNSLIYQD